MSENSWMPAPASEPPPKDPLAFLRNPAPLPPHIAQNVAVYLWARAVFLGERYIEPKPGFMSSAALVGAMEADDMFAAPEQPNLTKLSEWVPDEVGKSTGPIRAHDLYVNPSNTTDGGTTYINVTVQHMMSGAEVVYTTGSRTIQAFYIKALVRGRWPIDHQIKRIDQSVKGGRHMFGIFPPDAG